jgi:peptidoglycan/LPS O-acetylase OafA/YrhL
MLVAVTATTLISAIASRRESSHYEVLALPALCYVGLISYGVYAYHMIFYEIVARLFGAAALTPLGRIARLPAELILILALASVSYRFMETPISRFKRYFPYAGRASVPTPTHIGRERGDPTSVI